MKVFAGDAEYEIELPSRAMRLRFKEADAAEKALGCALEDARELQAMAAIVWILVKRQNAAVRFDDVDFDLNDFNEETAAAAEAAGEVEEVPKGEDAPDLPNDEPAT